jgi:hypothetical protein
MFPHNDDSNIIIMSTIIRFYDEDPRARESHTVCHVFLSDSAE